MASILDAVKKAAEQANEGKAAAPEVKVSDSSSLSANSSSGKTEVVSRLTNKR